jgi:hypothetical protein
MVLGIVVDFWGLIFYGVVEWRFAGDLQKVTCRTWFLQPSNFYPHP